MAEKKVLKSQIERDREEAAAVMDRFFAAHGDTRTRKERRKDAMLVETYTEEEAAQSIQKILDEPDEYLAMDGADGTGHFASKATRIEWIRAAVRV